MSEQKQGLRQFNLTIDENEANVIFSGLAELPGKVAYNIMRKIELQIGQQVQETKGAVPQENATQENKENNGE